MTDLSSLSDDELRAMYSAPDLTKMSDEELKAAFAAHNAKPKTDASTLGALSQGAADVVSGFGKTIKDYVSPEVGKAILASKVAQANPNYKNATEGFLNPEDGADKHTLGLDWSQLPRAAVEQAPGLAVDVAGQALTKSLGPVGRYIANALTYGGRTMGGEAEKRAQARTGDPNAEPTLEDKLSGVGSTIAQTGLNKVGLSSIVSPSKVTGTGLKGIAQAAGNVAKAAAAEGATSGAQDLVSQGFAKRGTDVPIDTKEALGATVMGTVGGGLFSTPKGAKDAVASVKFRDQNPDVHTAMAANRIVEAAGGSDKLADPNVAGAATKTALRDVHTELTDAAKRVSNPSTEAANAIQRAKDGRALSEKDLSAVDREGNDQLSSLVRQATSLSKLTDIGNYDPSEERFAGGASEFARQHARAALVAAGGLGALPHIVAQGGAGMDTLAGSLPHIGEAVTAAYAGNKLVKHLVDKPLGLASPAQTFAQKFGDATGNVRVPLQLDQSPTGPKVQPANSLMPAQPWGPIPEPTPKFKPDVLEPGITKIVSGIQRQKQQQTMREAMPLLRQLAEQNKPAPEPPGPDYNAMNEQVKGMLLMAAARRKVSGQQQAEAEAAASPMIQEQGGLDEVNNPAMGKRANELISAANALARLRRQPEPEEAPTPPPPVSNEEMVKTASAQVKQLLKEREWVSKVKQNSVPKEAPAPQPAPQAPAPVAPVTPGIAEPKVVDVRDAQPTQAGQSIIEQALATMRAQREQHADPEAFVLPESPHVFKEPKDAAEAIYQEARAGGKEIRHAEGFKAGVSRRLAGEERIYTDISNALPTVKERGDFHKYLSALWGSDSPEIVTQVREHMVKEFPDHGDTIMRHLSDKAIKELWTKPKRKTK